MSVVRSKEKISRFVWQISKRGGVGSERKNFLPRRLPNFLFPHYRSKRKFGAILVQRVADSLSKVSLAKRKKDRPQRAASPVLSVLCTKKPDWGSLRQLQSKFLPRCQNPQFCGFAPRGKLVGECLPQTLLWRLAPQKDFRSAGRFFARTAPEIPNRPAYFL